MRQVKSIMGKSEHNEMRTEMQDVQYIASISYGKDSMAMLHVIAENGLPLDRIITADVWFDDNIRADYPEMAQFKDEMDVFILENYGIKVEHFRARNGNTYFKQFYKNVGEKCRQTRIENARNFYFKHGFGLPVHQNTNCIYGFPVRIGAWCNSKLKIDAINQAKKSSNGAYSYIGIAADETKRIQRHRKNDKVLMPLVEFGITEKMAMEICRKNGTLAPTYQTGFRDGCWFCHNQQVSGLRRLRAVYPDLWEKLMRLDVDSPVTFHADGHTVHDFDKRFALEDCGMISERDRFKWEMINPNYEFQLKLLFEDEEDE